MQTCKIIRKISLAIMLLLPIVVFASDRGVVNFPNPNILGKKIFEGIICDVNIKSNNYKDYGIKPKQLLIDISNEGAISGITVIYNDNVKIEDVVQSVNTVYGKWYLKDFRNKPVKLWRVKSEKFAMSLSNDDEGQVQLLMIPFANR